MEWTITDSTGPAGQFHESQPGDETGHQVWIRRLSRPALVLGSTQPDQLVRRTVAEGDGIEVCRRRSGGGLVYIDPVTDCWIDLIVPRSSPRWDSDVGRAFHWVGDLWSAVLADLVGLAKVAEARTPSLDVARTPSLEVARTSSSSPLGRVWCYGDLGHGEVSIGGSKVVGLSQRRTRSWARVQGLVLGRWPGDALLPYVDLDALADQQPGRYPEAEALRPGLVTAGFPPGLTPPTPSVVTERFIAALTADRPPTNSG
jgi:lipoate-protein ligase A